MIAGIKHVTGAFAGKALRGNRQDGWTPIELVLKQVAKREPGPIRKQQLIPVRILVDEARKNNVQPLDLDETSVALLTDNCPVQNRRKSVEIGLRLLNDWRAWPELRTLLPAHPIPDPIVVRRLRNSIPDHLAVEITRWVETATRNVFDEISQTYIDQYDQDTINRYLAALRKFVSTAGTTGTDLGRTPYIENLITADIFHAVARSWIEDHQNGKRGALAKGSIAAYSQMLALIFERNGKDASFVRKGMKTNPVLKAGRKQHDTMAPKNRAFCESLLDIPGAETEFLQQHVILRAKADEILQRAKAAGRDLSGPELTAVRQLGTTSMFCALEAAVLPARIGNALDTRLHGCAAHLQLPNGKQKSGRVGYSADEVKNDNAMEGLFERDQRQGLQTLEWYLKKIRPLFPMSKASPFLFPSVKSKEKPLSAKVMTDWLKMHTRIAGRPISAHNYRHGMATILYARGNLDIKHIADYLGITPAVLLRNYAWIDERRVRKNVAREILDAVMQRRRAA
ncbi:hypothetical protein [Tropicimonas aquimaris]|uniref:Tyr recombinase domain-containing protein n=1 Tax=Tropicimonas aquimaris TaxID=914152 RepID=A0ABW3IJF6_9RHOB